MRPCTSKGIRVSKTVSIESELHAIRSICDGPESVRILLMSRLTVGHFASPTGVPLFDRVSGLARNGKAIPRVPLLRQDPTLTMDAQESLDGDVEACQTEDDATALVDQLEMFRKLRVIYNGSYDIVENIREPSVDTVEKALASMERIIIQARSGTDEIEMVTSGHGSNAKPVVDEVLKNKKLDRIRTGFRQFDSASGGFARKDLVLVAANTGGGKSVMAEQLGINAYLLQNRNVALVSFEMDEEELYARLLSNLTKLPFGKIYLRQLNAPQQIKAYNAWKDFNRHGEAAGCKFTIWCPTIDVTPAQIGAVLKPGRYDEVLIDYVGLVEAEQQAALWENLGEITKGFKGVARRNDCVCIVMAQLDEETKKIKYSKAMRHHSSYVWWWIYNEETEETGNIVVIQDKTRHCKKFNFPLLTNFDTMSFEDAKDRRPAGDVTSKEQAELERSRGASPKAIQELSTPEASAHEVASALMRAKLKDDSIALTEEDL